MLVFGMAICDSISRNQDALLYSTKNLPVQNDSAALMLVFEFDYVVVDEFPVALGVQ